MVWRGLQPLGCRSPAACKFLDLFLNIKAITDSKSAGEPGHGFRRQLQIGGAHGIPHLGGGGAADDGGSGQRVAGDVAQRGLGRRNVFLCAHGLNVFDAPPRRVVVIFIAHKL